MTVVETQPEVERVAGFSLLGSLGKRVLRPGGAELTDHLLTELAITGDDDVVEIAPGRGRTARLILDTHPASYTGVDRDPEAERSIRPMLTGPDQRFVLASVSRTGLEDGCCDVAIGEAVLTMHPRGAKDQIIAELARIVRPGGRIGLHEVVFHFDDIDTSTPEGRERQAAICDDLTSRFKVSFNAMTVEDWTTMLADHGFELRSIERAPLRLLEPDRIIADEGLCGATQLFTRIMLDPRIRRRVTRMRRAMRRNAPYLRAAAMVAVHTG